MDERKRMHLQDRVLILTLLVNVLVLLNQTVALYQAGAGTASWETAGVAGEDVGVEVSLDTGRPPTMLHGVWRNVRRVLRPRAPWLASWFVDDEPVTDAVVSIEVKVTGVNVESTALVDYYIEARPRGGGQPFRFLEAANVSVTVGGPGHVDVDNRGVGGHLEAMMLATTQTWTIDYHVYARAVTVGAISGESLVCEVEETLFETKKYEAGEPDIPGEGTWTQIPVQKSQGYVAYACLHNQSLVHPTSSETEMPQIYYGAAGGQEYTAWMTFRNEDAENYGYGSTMLPAVDPGNLVIHEAYVKLQAYEDSPPQRVTVHIYNRPSWSYTGFRGCDTWEKWLDRWSQRCPVEVTWNTPGFSEDGFYETPDIGTLVQYLYDNPILGAYYGAGLHQITFYMAPDGNPQSDAKSFYGWYHRHDYWDRWPTLSILWTVYDVSWYPIRGLGDIGIPFNVTTLALLALTAATAILWHENRRRMEAL